MTTQRSSDDGRAQDRAAFFRTALLLGLVRGETVVAWADAEIGQSPAPHPVFIELATTPPDDVTAMRLALFGLSLTLRATVVLAFDVPPTWDGEFYHRGALGISQGLGYADAAAGQPERWPWSHYPVGYSALLGAVYAVFGSGHHVAPLVNSVVGALTAVVGFLFAFGLLGRSRACIAGLT